MAFRDKAVLITGSTTSIRCSLVVELAREGAGSNKGQREADYREWRFRVALPSWPAVAMESGGRLRSRGEHAALHDYGSEIRISPSTKPGTAQRLRQSRVDSHRPDLRVLNIGPLRNC